MNRLVRSCNLCIRHILLADAELAGVTDVPAFAPFTSPALSAIREGLWGDSYIIPQRSRFSKKDARVKKHVQPLLKAYKFK